MLCMDKTSFVTFAEEKAAGPGKVKYKINYAYRQRNRYHGHRQYD